MVIPMGGMSQNGSPPVAARPYMDQLKYCVWAMWIAGGFRVVVFLDMQALFNVILACMCATLLLREDPSLRGCAEYLLRTPLRACAGQGAMGCLLPFLIMGFMSFITDFIMLLSHWDLYKSNLLLGIPMIVSVVAEGYGMFLGVRVFNIASPMDSTSSGPQRGGYSSLPGGPQQSSTQRTSVGGLTGAFNAGRADAAQSGGGGGGAYRAPAAAPTQKSFTPFSGQGQKLGG
mmetsp:Transcript_41508/g.90388  ORF Transcript_41508/g.90388 Transcript_41508/m.90388 type:complete len:231 (-) Transcript_41508:422-1114(-)